MVEVPREAVPTAAFAADMVATVWFGGGSVDLVVEGLVGGREGVVGCTREGVGVVIGSGPAEVEELDLGSVHATANEPLCAIGEDGADWV